MDGDLEELRKSQTGRACEQLTLWPSRTVRCPKAPGRGRMPHREEGSSRDRTVLTSQKHMEAKEIRKERPSQGVVENSLPA